MSSGSERRTPEVPCWQPVLFGALAGGLGWGIRGQYGHETGAMIAGALVGLTLVLLLVPRDDPWRALKAAAWCTVAIGFGGAMTYGQTVGLTQDANLVGNAAAWRWGMLGLSIKGALWIGFAGLFLGMGLSGRRYRGGELIGLMLGMLGLFFLGRWALNSPFDPAHRSLPSIYFSADWQWLPDAALKPRREVWGGMLFALAGGILYTGAVRRDPLAGRLAGWACLGGALGFPLGQSLQSYHAWHRADFQVGFWANLDPILNWWNFMETTFGLVLGATLGLGAWWNRRRIEEVPVAEAPVANAVMEYALVGVHTVLLVGSEVLDWGLVQFYGEQSLILGTIPILGVGIGRRWPLLVLLPITALPIAGKTLRNQVYEDHRVSEPLGWLMYAVLPILFALLVTGWLGRPWRRGVGDLDRDNAGRVVPLALLAVTWLYFGLNFAFFRFPWPWQAWTVRTPNALVFTLCAVGLTALALRRSRA